MERKYKLQMYEDALGEWRWRIVANNGNIVADSAEGYSSRAKCLQSFTALQIKMGALEIEE